jgi:twinkle protein
LPRKDANECLLDGYDGGHAAKWILESKTIAPKEIKQTSDFLDQAIRLITPGEDGVEAGLRTPLFGRRFLFRAGEMTLWTGHTSHGKTTLLNQVLIYAVREGQKVAMGSFEMSGARLLLKFASCISLVNDLTPDILKQTCDWMAEKVWIYDMMGITKRERLMELMNYSVRRHAVSHLVIDSLMKCDLSSEDYEEQRKFINQLHSFAIEHQVHVHLVGHPRKSDSDKEAPGNMDVHGGQSVVGQPDNIIAVWRNRDKEAKREDNKLTDHLEKTSPDTIAFVRKQRATGDEYKVWLWFHRKWNRFTTNHGEKKPEFEDFGIITVPEEPQQQTF